MLSRLGFTIAIGALSLVAGCSGQFKTDYDIAHERVAAYIAAHPALDPETKAAMRRFELRDGMAMDEVIATWGRPAVVQRFRGGARQYWFFGCDWPHLCTTPDPDHWWPAPDEIYRSQAYFENGRVVSWRD